MRRFLLPILLSVAFTINSAPIDVKIGAPDAKKVINKNIYGHFAEHLGTCIYGGIWVGEDSPIPNTKGYRNDVLNALKELNIPVLRWPGGCFADEYHWMDGIGPKSNRPKMVNNNWGGTIEDNSFGTHEFFNLCEILGCEPYLSMNVGSGTVEEMAKWVEYITSEGDSPMANLRRANGREKAWKLKYAGIGNESWGCGGDMTPEYYSDLFRRYGVYCRNYDDNRLFKIASGASDYDYNWTEVLMKNSARFMHGISLHYYTVKGWSGSKGSATKFDNDEYYWTMAKCLEIEEVMQKHIGIMDKYDPSKRVALLVDEWGTWWDEEPGTVRGHLFQQNTMRDAFVAALSLNIFQKYTDRVQMANIAQIVNVLQSMILTRDASMVLTPTYYVFNMYKPFHDATYIPLTVASPKRMVGNREIDLVSIAAAKTKEGKLCVSLTNIDDKQEQVVELDMSDYDVKMLEGQLLTSKNVDDHNTFEKPNVVAPTKYTTSKVNKGKVKITVPAKSIMVLMSK